MGVKGKERLQGEETELCERMRRKFGKSVVYNPNAIVYHKTFRKSLIEMLCSFAEKEPALRKIKYMFFGQAFFSKERL